MTRGIELELIVDVNDFNVLLIQKYQDRLLSPCVGVRLIGISNRYAVVRMHRYEVRPGAALIEDDMGQLYLEHSTRDNSRSYNIDTTPIIERRIQLQYRERANMTKAKICFQAPRDVFITSIKDWCNGSYKKRL